MKEFRGHIKGSHSVEVFYALREANLIRRELKDMGFDLVTRISIAVNGFLEEKGVGWGGNDSNVNTMHGE